MALISLILDFILGHKYYIVTYYNIGKPAETYVHTTLCNTKQEAEQVYQRTMQKSIFPLYIESFRSHRIYNDKGHPA